MELVCSSDTSLQFNSVQCFNHGQLGRMFKSLKIKNTQEKNVDFKNIKRTRKNYCKLVYGEPHSPTVKYEVGRNVTERLNPIKSKVSAQLLLTHPSPILKKSQSLKRN